MSFSVIIKRGFFRVLVLLTPCLLIANHCGTDQGLVKEYTYTLRNRSGVPIEIKSFDSNYPVPREVKHLTVLENNRELTKTYKDWLPPTGYDFRAFFGGQKFIRFIDSIQVIYNKQKYTLFVDTCDIDNKKNPLNLCVYNDTKEIFTFTAQDYANAEECRGHCN